MMKKNAKRTVIVKNPDGGSFEMEKDKFEKDIKYMQRLSKDISKYGIVNGIDPVYKRNAQEAHAAKILLISCAVLFVISILTILILASLK